MIVEADCAKASSLPNKCVSTIDISSMIRPTRFLPTLFGWRVSSHRIDELIDTPASKANTGKTVCDTSDIASGKPGRSCDD